MTPASMGPCCAWWVPVMGLSQEAGLEELARQHLSVPRYEGASAG